MTSRKPVDSRPGGARGPRVGAEGCHRSRRARLSDSSRGLIAFPYALLSAAVLVLLPACRETPPPGSDVVVRVNGEEIAYQAFEAELREAVEGSELALESEVLSRLFDQFLDDRLLLRLAVDKGLEAADPDERQAIDFLLAGIGGDAVTDEEVAAYYRAHREEYRLPERVHLRQILAVDRQTAEAALAALAAGEDFAAVAARYSSEPNAALGGDQGQLGREDLPSLFADIIFSLPAGGISDIVEADYGLHIFQVLAHLPAEVAPLDQVEEEIRLLLLGREVDEILEGLVAEARERYNVRVYATGFPFEYQGAYASPNDE